LNFAAGPVNLAKRFRRNNARPTACCPKIDSPPMTAVGRRVVVVRAFIKKTQKTPRAEIELALARADEIE
jgi:hypothetical protein